MADVLAHARRWRAPITVIVIVLVIVTIIVAGIRIGLAVSRGQEIFAALWEHHTDLVGVPGLLVLLLLQVVNIWTRPALPSARRLARASAAVSSGAVALALICGLVALVGGDNNALTLTMGVLSMVVWSVVPVLLCIGMIIIARGLGPAGRLAAAGAGVAAVEEEATATEGEGSAETSGEAESTAGEVQPVWQQDEAAGAGWTTAADAAAGAEAASWGEGASAVSQETPARPQEAPGSVEVPHSDFGSSAAAADAAAPQQSHHVGQPDRSLWQVDGDNKGA